MAPKKILKPKEVKRVIKDYKKLLKREGINFSALYLFGSYAKKRQRDWSDIDVAVVSKKFGRDYIKESVLLNQIADKVNLLIQAHPLHPRSLHDPYSTFAAEINKYGKRV